MKIYVTGIGCISGIGLNVTENITSLREGKHGMGKVTLFPTALDVPVSEVKLANEKSLSRTALLGIHAATEALKDCGITKLSSRVGLISSTSVGGMDLSENFYIPFRNNPNEGRLRDVISHDCGDSTEQIARHLGLTGFRTTVSTACSSAANAIMLGARLIKAGYLDTVIAGGTDSLCRFTLNGFNSLMILDKEHCRPFDHSRAGLNLGEGAGYVVLQAEHSLNRDPYCELTGYANVNEAYHQTGSSPDGDGPYSSMLRAIQCSGIDAHQINYINVHGTGTPSNDRSEGVALKRLFGENVPPFSSVKSFIGHTLGASEGIEAVYSVLSVYNGYMYPNLNFATPAEETMLVPVTQFSEGNKIKHVLSNSFGFGGSNSSLLFSKASL
ncbi:beta-ketoacyl-[acyl-carrier-protein] synthase family protein [Bacteroides sp. 519]|uniref:beta-ketoacyl-[acyl-carrier-protein] synthase family protein n=1 Tax=Bacteroides sp. 519 TaxID=2302937 RepID=UPI0013D85FD6|nr:beta-ketoacyl-[acyl-carrier-protein] synthase family protein [Bacteroides sp. 519]NDV58759.1 beta-ketoacyl-[acyl-carrier-protein] synthase family protein [Bacteroides sp. 519]